MGTYSFPVSEDMAGVYMTLEPGALQEMYWHAFAAEWAYVIEGRTRITLTSPEGEAAPDLRSCGSYSCLEGPFCSVSTSSVNLIR